MSWKKCQICATSTFSWPSGLARSVYYTRSLIFSRCWRRRSLFFTAKVDLVRLFSSQCLKFQTLRALELLRKFENIAGVQLYLHDKYQRILFQYGRYIYFEISYRAGPCCSKGGYHYPLDNSIGFASIYPLDSTIQAMNNRDLGPVSRKFPKLFGRISGDIILFVSSKRRRLEAQNFAVISTCIPFTTYDKTFFTE